MEVLENLKLFFLVSCGAIIGSNIRYIIYQKLGNNFSLRKNIRILLINILASFLLGLLCSFLADEINDSYNFRLLFSVGFLGGLSTFSSFIYDLYEVVSEYKYFEAIKLLIFSLGLGIVSFWLGSVLGG